MWFFNTSSLNISNLLIFPLKKKKMMEGEIILVVFQYW